jgi:hypothetical protein
LDDRDAGDLVRDGLMRVPRRDDVDESAGRLCASAKFRARVARRQVRRVAEIAASAARVSADDHDLRALDRSF